MLPTLATLAIHPGPDQTIVCRMTLLPEGRWPGHIDLDRVEVPLPPEVPRGDHSLAYALRAYAQYLDERGVRA